MCPLLAITYFWYLRILSYFRLHRVQHSMFLTFLAKGQRGRWLLALVQDLDLDVMDPCRRWRPNPHTAEKHVMNHSDVASNGSNWMWKNWSSTNICTNRNCGVFASNLVEPRLVLHDWQAKNGGAQQLSEKSSNMFSYMGSIHQPWNGAAFVPGMTPHSWKLQWSSETWNRTWRNYVVSCLL